MTRYFIDSKTATLPNASRVVPTFTATSGLNFERNTRFFGNAYTQTLEPTAYYVYIPNRNQNNLPNFESGLQDINFATIFSENQFSGHDRINDANQLTVGVRSRLINPDSGAEVLRAGLAQRYYFKEQQVTLPGVPARSNQSSRSDVLAALSGAVTPHVSADLGWQYNTDERKTARSSLALRYQPQQGKLLNLAYRQNVAASIRQFDVSGQWPLANRWNTVGRWNYSVPDRRVLEGLAGLEYDGGCFVFRVVAHRVSTATSRASTAVFLELELNGLTSVGSNSLDLLRRNVSGYWRADPRAARPNEYAIPER
jgi:LPS-assembly protein